MRLMQGHLENLLKLIKLKLNYLKLMKKMMKTKKMTDYFAASPSGKMILFTKKKMIIEMPPLSTVVPML